MNFKERIGDATACDKIIEIETLVNYILVKRDKPDMVGWISTGKVQAFSYNFGILDLTFENGTYSGYYGTAFIETTTIWDRNCEAELEDITCEVFVIEDFSIKVTGEFSIGDIVLMSDSTSYPIVDMVVDEEGANVCHIRRATRTKIQSTLQREGTYKVFLLDSDLSEALCIEVKEAPPGP